MNCNHECSNCQNGCIVLCPICEKNAREVKFSAAKTLVIEPKYLKKDELVYICQNKKCDVVYFQLNNPKYYFKNEIKKPIWFKEKVDKYMVCYCREIYLSDIIKIIKESKDDILYTKEDIMKKFPKVLEDCAHNNPLGESCDKVFENAIKYAYHITKGE